VRRQAFTARASQLDSLEQRIISGAPIPPRSHSVLELIREGRLVWSDEREVQGMRREEGEAEDLA
jgi:hypothetical protein